MKFTRNFLTKSENYNYRGAVIFKNQLMFAKVARNPRISKHPTVKGGWRVTYEANKFLG